MEVHSLVESVVMKNRIEIIVNKTTVEQDLSYPNKPYLIRVDGLFKRKNTKNFYPAHFTVVFYVDSYPRGLGSWSTECSEGDTFSFFDLSSSDKPSEAAQFLCYCLKQQETYNQIKNDFGVESEIYKWVEAGGPILFNDAKKMRYYR